MNETQLLLIHLLEELSEAQKEITKALRFGLDDINPETHEKNAEAIVRELSDIQILLDELYSKNILDKEEQTERQKQRKQKKNEKWIEYSRLKGILK